MKSKFLIDFYIYLIGGTIGVFSILLGLPPLSTPAREKGGILSSLSNGYPTVCRLGVIMGSVRPEKFPPLSFSKNGSVRHQKPQNPKTP
jgi:hypothetical protein